MQDVGKRIRDKRKSLPNLPFNALRDTSTNIVRQLAGEEIARLQCSHAHQSVDSNLRCYSNPLFNRLFETLDQLEQLLEPVFEVAGPEHWKEQRKNILSKQKIKEIEKKLETNACDTSIARELGVSR